MLFTRILVPTDFSSEADRGWDTAQQMARALGAELILLHVLCSDDLLRSLEGEERVADTRHRHSDGELAIAPAASDPPDIHVTAQEWAEQRLERYAAAARESGLNVLTVLRAGVPDREVIDTARDERADLIVLSTHGRGGLDRLVRGSVSDPIIRKAPCPVLSIGPGVLALRV